MVYIRNDDVALDTDPEKLKKFCKVIDEFDGFFEIIHAINTRGNVRLAKIQHNNLVIMEKCGEESILNNKKLIDFLNTRKEKDLFCLHGIYHVHPLGTKNFKKLVTESIKEFQGLPFVNNTNMIPWFVYPFNEHSKYTDSILNQSGLIPKSDQQAHKLEEIVLGKNEQLIYNVFRIHSWRLSVYSWEKSQVDIDYNLLRKRLRYILDTLIIQNKKLFAYNPNRYLKEIQLQKPEQVILDKLKNKLKDMKMLDIGVGTGRTTLHFANLVKKYIGIDYSKELIDICKKRFSNLNFKVCDARNMEIFENNSFDFILFSYNGLDCVSHEDRLKILYEIIRICKNEGYFCFSTHIQPNLKKDYFYKMDVGLLHYYTTPVNQLQQLSDVGFQNIQIYSLDGKQIKNNLDSVKDCWIYFLCNKNNLKLSIIKTEKEFKKIHIEWNNLLNKSKSNNIFLTWEWLYTWWDEYKDINKQLYIFAIRDKKELIGIAPFMLQGYQKINKNNPSDSKKFIAIEFLGTGEACSDYLDIISEQGKEFEVCRKIFEFLKPLKFWNNIFLREIPNNSHTLHYFSNLTEWKTQIGISTKCPSVVLPNTWEEYMKSLSKKTRKHINYYTNKSNTVFTQLSNKEEIESYMEDLVRLHKIRWNKKEEKDGFTERVIQFNKKAATKLFDKDWLRLYTLKIKNKTIASLFASKYNNKIFFFQSGFDPEYNLLSPGFVLIAHCIKQAIKEGLREFDFIRGESGYKYKFANIVRENCYINILRK